MTEELKNGLLKFYSISDEAFEKLTACFKRMEFRKNDIIIESGKFSDYVFYVESGLIRTYFCDSKCNEVTLCFGVCGDMFASTFCYYAGEPAFMQAEAVTDVVTYGISKNDLERLCSENLEISNWMRVICIEQLYCLERRSKIFGNEDAASRYQSLIKVRPQIIREVPLKHIASYLGITQQSLSRLRARMGGRKEEK